MKERVPVRYEINDVKRDEFPEYPVKAYREVVVNAIVHFDYFLGDTIAIEKHKSSIRILNKGELLFSQKDFGVRSEARNRLLVDLLARTDFMEKAGTGIKRITDSCSKNKNKVSFGFSDAFLVTIDTNIKENVTENVTETRSNLILELIRNNSKITTSNIGRKINISRRTVAREIDALKKEGLLKRIGPDKGGEWKVLKRLE